MNNMVNYNNQQQNNNGTCNLSIIRKNPFVIEDSIVSLASKLNDIGVIYIAQSRMASVLIAHVINNKPQMPQPGIPLSRQSNTLKFTLHWNSTDNVIGFIENSDGIQNSFDTFLSAMPGQEQPLNIITVGDLVNYLQQYSSRQQFAPQMYQY